MRKKTTDMRWTLKAFIRLGRIGHPQAVRLSLCQNHGICKAGAAIIWLMRHPPVLLLLFFAAANKQRKESIETLAIWRSCAEERKRWRVTISRVCLHVSRRGAAHKTDAFE